MFEKKRPEETSLPEENKMLEKAAPGRHDIALQFERETKDALYREWEIFESRYGAVLNLKEDASKIEVKRALSRVKRAAMDARDALKELGQFKG